MENLRQIADEHRLCYGALGLEKLEPGRACFRAQLKQCAGVCRGDESEEAHHGRLLQSLEALRVTSAADARQLDALGAGFDADGYKILCQPLLGGQAEIILF